MPLCDAFMDIPGVEFTFIATEKVPEDRIKFGYKHEFSHLTYYREAIEEEDRIDAEKLCFNSDVVIIGSAPMHFVKRRIKAGKLTFTYNERWFKEGFWKHPGDVYRAIKDFTLNNNKNFYQLCSSAYTAYDFNRVFAFPNRKFRWGYFPEVKPQNADELLQSKTKNSILWVARFLELKHPEAVIEVAKRLKEDGLDFEINMIGGGILEEEMRQQVKQQGLNDCVHFLGTMPPEEVRKYMEHSQIFLFTSDFHEGWGAVLNEAMNSCCAVVASHAIGSVPYLIKHGENGYIYSSGDHDELYQYVKNLLANPALAHQLGKNAYQTMTNLWNSKTAVTRLYEFCSAKLSGAPLPIYQDGPLSKDLGKVKNHGTFQCEKH